MLRDRIKRLGTAALPVFPGGRVLLAAIGISLAGGCGRAPDPPGEGWTVVTRLPTARGELAAAVLGDRILVMGGMTGLGSSSDLVEAYDLISGRWSTLAPLPRPLNHAASTTLNGVVYVVGGSEDFLRGAPLPSVYAYDLAGELWRPRADMPEGRWAPGAAAVGGRLYVIGGTGGTVPSPVMIYDPAEDAWSEGAALPTARDHLGVVAWEGRIFVIGGRAENQNLSLVEIYDPGADTWSQGAPMPTARSGMAAVALENRIYVMGGENPASVDQVYSENEAYNPVSDRWSPAPPLPTPRHGVAGVAAGGRLFLLGGSTNPGALSFLAWADVVEAFSPAQ